MIIRCIFLLFLLLAFGPAQGALAQGGDGGVSADRAKSNALTPEQREQARSLFESAFEHSRSGRLQAAQADFERGLAIDPANAVANFYLAETSSRLGDSARARTLYNKVIAIAPSSPEAIKAEAALKTLQAASAPDPEAAKLDASNRVVLFTLADAPTKTVAEAIAYIKANPNTGVGCASSQACAAAEQFRKVAGFSFVIPYRAEAAVKQEVAHKAILLGFVRMPAVLQSVSEGQMLALAVSGTTHSPNMAQVPTMSEAGISGP